MEKIIIDKLIQLDTKKRELSSLMIQSKDGKKEELVSLYLKVMKEIEDSVRELSDTETLD